MWPGNKRDTDCFVLSVGKRYKALCQFKSTSDFVFFRTDAQNSQYPVSTKPVVKHFKPMKIFKYGCQLISANISTKMINT